MILKVLAPTRIILKTETGRVAAFGAEGAFVILPRHIDFVSALVPGILSYEEPGGQERFLAVDEGLLVKCGDEVRVSTRNALAGPDLGQLERAVEETFQALDEQEKRTRTALARLEADFIRQFTDLGK